MTHYSELNQSSNPNLFIGNNSSCRELFSAGTIWSSSEIFRLSAIFIYINQLVIPKIITVEKQNSNRFDSYENMLKDLERTKYFLQCLVGLAKDVNLQGGIHNPKVIQMLARYGSVHWKFSGMENWMMNYMGYIITIAPLAVQKNSRFSRDLINLYYNYMKRAWKIINVEIGDIDEPPKTENGIAVKYTARNTSTLHQDLTSLKLAYEFMYGAREANLIWRDALSSLETNILEIVSSNKL
jgi:hypothetical protein